MTPINHRDYRVETKYAVAWVRVRGGVIVEAAPIYKRRWMGQSFEKMRREAAEVIDITDAEDAE